MTTIQSTWRRIRVGAIGPLAALMAAVGCDRQPPVHAMTVAAAGETGRLANAWDDLFAESPVRLLLPWGAAVPQRVARINVGPDGSMFVPDGRARRILHFAPDGRLVQEITGGKDFELRYLGATALDQEGNLFVYDPGRGRVTVLRRPTYTVASQIPLLGSVNDIVPLADGGLVAYDPADAAGAFKLINRKGRQVEATRPITDTKLRIFHGRTQNGGVTRDASGDLFGILPSTFELVRLSPDLDVREVLRRPPGDPWAPNAPPFPAHLNAFSYRPEHERWWDSFTHIGRPYALAPGVLLVTVYKSRGLGTAQEFVNLYTSDGRVLAEGLPVPHEGHVVGAANGSVYVFRDTHLVAGDSLAPPEFYRASLRERRTARPGVSGTAPASRM